MFFFSQFRSFFRCRKDLYVYCLGGKIDLGKPKNVAASEIASAMNSKWIRRAAMLACAKQEGETEIFALYVQVELVLRI